MQILRLHPGSSNLTLGLGPSNLPWSKPPRRCLCKFQLETHGSPYSEEALPVTSPSPGRAPGGTGNGNLLNNDDNDSG